MAAGCQEKPDGGDGSVSLHSDAEIVLPAAEADTVISFTATADWTAAVEGGDWLSVSPASGKAGEISATLSATANSEADARTATVNITCGTGKATVTVTQEGAAGEGPEDPDTPATGLIKNITSTDISNDDTYRMTFAYDSEARLTTMEISNTIYEDSEEITYSYRYEIEYSEESIVISTKGLEGYGGEEGEYSEWQEAVLDENGRTVSTKSTSTDYYGDGRSDETEVNARFSYNSTGQLIKGSGTESGENGNSDFHIDFTWTDGDMTGLSIDSYKTENRYSEYDNTGNIDINYILMDEHPYWMTVLGIIGALGERSEHYVWPGLWDYTPVYVYIGGEVTEPVHKDLIGTVKDLTYTREVAGQPELTYNFNEDKLLTDVITKVPIYNVTYTQKFKYVLEEGLDPVPDEDGYYHYGVYLEEAGEPVETGREAIGPEINEVHIGY